MVGAGLARDDHAARPLDRDAIDLAGIRRLRELARLLPSTAQRLVGETIEDVDISALRDGDLVLVRPGASVPADGIVRSGKSDVNESMITGESAPVAKAEGAKVIAGTVNGSGSLRVEVTGTAERTALAHIMRWLNRRRRPALAPRLSPTARHSS